MTSSEVFCPYKTNLLQNHVRWLNITIFGDLWHQTYLGQLATKQSQSPSHHRISLAVRKQTNLTMADARFKQDFKS